MARVRPVLVAYAVALVVLLTALDVRPVGWTVALGCAAVLATAAARRAGHDGVEVLGPADLVTITRATLACGVAGLATDAARGAEVTVTLVVVASVALVLDLVDGRVARGTGTVSAYGARLDGEADAFLVLVLSLHVARTEGAWVSAMGLVRYAYAGAVLLLPWMQRTLPPRHWRKVVAAYVGVALVLAASGVAPQPVTTTVLVVAALLLAESFGWDVVWCWRGRAVVNRAAGRHVRPGKTPQRSR